MLVTDLALQDMEREAQSLIGGLNRIFARLRRRPAVSQARIRSRPSTPSGEQGRALVSSSSFTIAPPLQEVRAVDRTPCARTDSSRLLPLAGSDATFKWRRHPLLRDQRRELDDRSPDGLHKGARAAAIRGLFLARSERLAEARASFAQAALDTSIDLSELPGFWQLSRGAMLVAAVAYEDVERYRDASALAARVRTRYRPRAVAPVTDLPRRPTSGGRASAVEQRGDQTGIR